MAKIRESMSARRQRAEQILATLEQTYTDSRIALDFQSPFQLLIALILAAQNTDARVNMVTPGLFERYPTPQDFVDAPQEELERAIFTCGFYRQKSKAIKATSQALVERFGGEVPSTMEELLTLPGIGRKSANAVLGYSFGIPGVVVDTHVIRIANLLKLVDVTDAVKIEMQLMELFPKEKWTSSGHLIQSHGRAICIARRPQCTICPIALLCPSALVGAPVDRADAASGKATGRASGARARTGVASQKSSLTSGTGTKRARSGRGTPANSANKGAPATSPDARRLDAGRRDAKHSDVKRADAKLPDTKHRDTEGADAKRPGAKRADVKRADAKRPGAERADAERADAKSPGAKRADAKLVDAKRPGAERPGAERADAKHPAVDTKRPGAKRS